MDAILQRKGFKYIRYNPLITVQFCQLPVLEMLISSLTSKQFNFTALN